MSHSSGGASKRAGSSGGSRIEYPAWMDDDDELYLASVRIREKLESIEANAAPALDARELGQEAARYERAQRRERMRDMNVNVITLPAQHALLHAASIGMLDAIVTRVPARTLTHAPESGTESVIDFSDACVLVDSLEDATFRIIEDVSHVDSVRTAVANLIRNTSSRGSAPLSSVVGSSSSSASDSDSDSGAGVAHSPWAQRHRAIMAATKAPHSSVPALATLAPAASHSTPMRKQSRAPRGGSAKRAVTAPPFRILPRETGSYAPSITASFRAMHAANGARAGMKRGRSEPVASSSSAAPPPVNWFVWRHAETYDSYVPTHLPNLKAIDEHSYVDGYSVRAAWSTAAAAPPIARYDPEHVAGRHLTVAATVPASESMQWLDAAAARPRREKRVKRASMDHHGYGRDAFVYEPLSPARPPRPARPPKVARAAPGAAAAPAAPPPPPPVSTVTTYRVRLKSRARGVCKSDFMLAHAPAPLARDVTAAEPPPADDDDDDDDDAADTNRKDDRHDNGGGVIRAGRDILSTLRSLFTSRRR